MRLTLLTLAVLAACSAARADTIIDHANGYTLNAAGKLVRFSALAIDDKGKVIGTGTEQAMAARAPKATHIDAQGKTLLPGLIDAHGHVFELGEIAASAAMFGTTSLDQALKAVGAFAQQHPERP